MKKVIFVNEDYFPSKVAGGSAKSISLLASLFERNNMSSEVKTSSLKFSEINESNIYVLNSIFGKTNRKSLLNLILSKHSPKVIYIPRGELSSGSMSNRLLLKTFYVFFLRIIINLISVKWVATSLSESNFIEKRIGKADIAICPNLIDFKNMRSDKLSFPTKNLVSIGRIEKKKNQYWLSKLNKEIDIIGPSLREKEYVDLVINAKKLHVLGGKNPDEMIKIYRDYKVNLLPTLNENFGHVIVESILSGTPVIVSENTPWTDFINDNKLGMAVKLDVKSWDLAINEVLNNNKEYKTNCINSIEKFKELNSKYENKWIKLINQL
jgi:glycosyltransferase involved in cell wall biosynthesis